MLRVRRQNTMITRRSLLAAGALTGALAACHTARELLSIWTGETARTIFPGRKIGSLQEGYEASFLALEGG
jgi:predicted amidohydrolase YtcJ